MSRFGLIELHDNFDFSTPIAPKEIVMCKDCKYASDSEYTHCSYVTWYNGENDYCSRGERKGE